MKILFIGLMLAMLVGCYAPYKYNHNLTPYENAQLEMEHRRLNMQAHQQRSQALHRWKQSIDSQEKTNNSGTTQCRWVGDVWTCNSY